MPVNWQATNPIPTLFPLKPNTNTSVPSGILTGTMSGTNTIYSQIIDMSLIDNIGVEFNYVGTATGTLTVWCSNSGINFYSLTFNPVLQQPAGSSNGYLIDISGLPWKYFMFEYVNTSGLICERSFPSF